VGNTNSAWYHDQIKGIQGRAHKKITHHRLNEAGEMKDLGCVLKACNLAKDNEKLGIKTFTYTSRQDLWEKYKTAITHSTGIVINGSGFMAHNEYRVVPQDYVAQKGEYWCPDKCYNCRMCKERLGVVILSKERHVKKSKTEHHIMRKQFV